MKEESISVIFPVYNEEGNIEKVVNSVLEFLPDIFSNFEVIIVDDGSRDRSPQIINQLCRESTNLKVIHHERNMSYGMALRSGFAVTKYPLVFFMDSDGQFDIEDMKDLLKFIYRFDIVVGIRRKRMDSVYRIALGKLYNQINSLFFNIRMQDVNCGFKLLRRSVLDNIPLYSKSGFINVEILVKARDEGYLIKEVPVGHRPRVSGKQKGATIKALFFKLLEITKFSWQRSLLPRKFKILL